jgi:hypothetical protein
MGSSLFGGTDMKIAAIVTAVALVTGTAAFANDYGTHSDRDTSRHAATSQSSDAQATHEGLLAKTKRALHRIGDKMRGTGSKMARATHTPDPNRTAARDNDTRSMGAGREDMHDSGRQGRMDDAYNNWHNKHPNDKR